MKKRRQIKIREEASTAAAPPSPPPHGKGRRNQRKRSEGGDRSPSSGEQTTVRSKRRRKRRKAKQPIRDLDSHDALVQEESAALEHKASSRPASSSPDSDLAGSAGEASASPTVGKTEGKRRKSRTRQKKRSLSDSRKESSVVDVPESKHQSGEEQEEATSFDAEQTHTWLKVGKKKLRPSSSQDLGEIAQNEDEQHFDKRPPADFGKIAKDEDEQHHDKIGIHAIEDDEQKQRVPEHVQALLRENNDAIFEKTRYWLQKRNLDSPPHCDYHEYDEQELKELNEQLALYRLRGYELTLDEKLAELDDATLKLQYPSTRLQDNGYFEHYEESLQWYFDPDLCWDSYFSNYQRLMLCDNAEYVEWDFYHSTRSTYQEDVVYVQYCEAIAKEVKWIEDYLADDMIVWERVKDVAYIQALEIAVCLRVPSILVNRGFNEYIRGILIDYRIKVFDDVHFEIWKRVAKQKMSFEEALLEIHRENMFPLRSYQIENELKNKPARYPIKDQYDAHVACIDETASEDEARRLIRQATTEMVRTCKYYLDYVRDKLKIAKDIGLISKEGN